MLSIELRLYFFKRKQARERSREGVTFSPAAIVPKISRFKNKTTHFVPLKGRDSRSVDERSTFQHEGPREQNYVITEKSHL